MRLKQRPEDFSVKESFRFDEVPSGSHRVYLMDKQKLSTFDAIARIRERFGLKPRARLIAARKAGVRAAGHAVALPGCCATTPTRAR